MATPSYRGQNQPQPSADGWFSGLFGGGTPVYAAAKSVSTQSASAQQPVQAQPAQGTTTLPFLAFAAPAYKLAPVVEGDCDDNASSTLAIVIPQATDPQT